MTDPPKTVLVLCYSHLASDPRVMRQIDWLIADGWIVDTLGFGSLPHTRVREHFEMERSAGLRHNALFRLAFNALLPYRLRFRMFEGTQVTAAFARAEFENNYDLILANEIDLLPWVARNSSSLLSEAPGAHCHVDLHEYHEWAPPADHPRLARWLFKGYHKWLVSFIGRSIFETRSTVANKLAEMYAEDFAIPRPTVVRNAPAFVDQAVREVDPQKVNLVHHGYAELSRGLHLLIDAVPLLESRFVLNLMLTGSADGKNALMEMSSHLGDRIVFIDPVPMNQVATELNRFDLELIFFPPTSKSFQYALPNKFFEAVQGRLGVIIGRSESMIEITDLFENALVVEGWTAEALASAINTLTAQGIKLLKNSSAICAQAINADKEAAVFLQAIAS